MIRSYEKSHPDSKLSERALSNGRVPIFAVSASLVERERQTYINAGFDGWILKPIDFKRLNILLAGIVEDKTRNSCLYKPGEWEKGGWFHRRLPPSALHVSTTPSTDKAPDGYREKSSSHGSSESGSITPTETKRPLIHDERLDIPRVIEEESYFPPTSPATHTKDEKEIPAEDHVKDPSPPSSAES